MSYAVSASLQAAIFARLSTDPTLSDLVGSAIYDAAPTGLAPAIYVTLGEEDVRDRSDKSGPGAWHDLVIRVVTSGAGFQAAKAAAGAVSDALLSSSPPAMARGRIVGLWFLRARARRIGANDERRIEMRFRARTEDT